MNPTDVYQAKRSISNFSDQVADNLAKPKQKFLKDMLYGLSKCQQPILSEIGRSLNEKQELIYTAKRLSRQAANFSELEQMDENYLGTVKPFLTDDALVLCDLSDLAKPCGEQFEKLETVRDGSTDRLEKGYWTTNFSIASPKTKHPVPVYSHLYSAAEKDFVSANVETYKGLNTVKRLFGDIPYTLVFDRGYDANDLIEYVLNQKASFILRLKNNRLAIHQRKTEKVSQIALKRKGKICFQSEIKSVEYDLKVSHVPIQLPAFKGIPLNLVIVHGYGKSPMKLLTNKPIQGKTDVLSILKAYITRWKIEESFRVQKQELHLEKVRLLSLNGLRLIHRLTSYLIGYHSLLLEKENLFGQLLLHHAKPLFSAEKVKFHLYRTIRGLANILKQDQSGIQIYKRIQHRNRPYQICLQI